MTKDIYSTDHVKPGKFRTHGRVEFEVQGDILWATAIGPFNVEFVCALEKVVASLFPVMSSKGTWVGIFKFEHSALCSLEVLVNLTEMMKRQVALKVAPAGSAFVMSPDVEGAHLMGPHYARCHREAGIRHDCFHTIELARQWAESVLNPATRLGMTSPLD